MHGMVFAGGSEPVGVLRLEQEAQGQDDVGLWNVGDVVAHKRTSVGCLAADDTAVGLVSPSLRRSGTSQAPHAGCPNGPASWRR